MSSRPSTRVRRAVLFEGPLGYMMIFGAILFAVGHPVPPGPIGMGLFLLGIVWLELRPREAPAPEVAAPVPS